MLKLRYTSNSLYKPPYVYAIGGRSYGEDDIAILKSCERFDL